MNIRELYAFLNDKIPASLSCEWDNDGLMCCPDPERKVTRVLLALDVTAEVVRRAVDGGYDAVVSHHPMIFHPLPSIEPSNPVAKKAIDLIGARVSVMSFHTRLDAVTGGVNDCLAEAIGLHGAEPFGVNGETIGRVGVLDAETTLSEFCARVKAALGADAVVAADAKRPVHCVAVLGGSGSDDVLAARAAGADTYLSGELKHNWLMDAPELGINLIAAGHFHTENVVLPALRRWILETDPTVEVDLMNSNTTVAT